jgi:hypothetical protein
MKDRSLILFAELLILLFGIDLNSQISGTNWMKTSVNTYDNLKGIFQQNDGRKYTTSGETVRPLENRSIIAVTNNRENVNGDTSCPDSLINNPGPDGISLPEAMIAANNAEGPHSILFDTSLQGTTIELTDGLPCITENFITINADIDSNGVSDITIDGSNSSDGTCFRIFASDINIFGFKILGFSHTGIERVTLKYNAISAQNNAIAIYNWGNNFTINDINIVQNTLTDYQSYGVAIAAAQGPTQSNNSISDITISRNTISNTGFKIAVYVVGAIDDGGINNIVNGLNISNNIIMGHTNSSLLISAGNESNCQNNRVKNVSISNNNIDGTPVTIEIVGGVGFNATADTTSKVAIIGNTLQGGGIQIVGGYTSAHHCSIDSVTVGWNRIFNCAANGIKICAGEANADYNTTSSISILNNLIAKSADAGILCHGEDYQSHDNSIDSVYILNNTIVENGNSWAGSINLNSKDASNLIRGVRIVNNIMWNNSGGDCIRGSETPDIVKYSILGDPRYVGSNENFYSDPLFVNPANMNYRLQQSSPAIDQGDSISESAGEIDLDSNSRIVDGNKDGIAVIDIGAFEYDIISGIVEKKQDNNGSDKNYSYGATVLYGPLRLPKGENCTILDITGRAVIPSKMKPGIYFIKANGQITEKIVKIR